MIKNKDILIGIFLLLTSCNGCWSPMPVVTCGGYSNNKSNFDSYEKIGINQVQKIQDISDCGAIPDKYGNIFTPLRQANSGEQQGWAAIKKFDNCMKTKGYKYNEY